MKDERWAVPAAYPGERIFVICGGPSVKDQKKLIGRITGPVIAVKQSALLKPDAFMMLIAAKEDVTICADVFRKYTGPHLVSRKHFAGLPPRTKFIGRVKAGLSTDPRFVGGLDAGTSAINAAFHAIGGKGEIVVLGYDMTGGRWFNGERHHHLPFPPQDHFDRHLAAAAVIAKQLDGIGVKVWNASPISKATFFEKRRLEDFL